MSRVPISFACAAYDRMVPLLTGEASPLGIDLNFIPIAMPRETFDRMAGAQEFDAAEFSSSEFISRTGAGASPFVALPVFPSRMFRHSFITVNTQKVRTPKDLQGKRIGVPLYTMTAAVWIRGLLMHEYGVDLSGVQWVQGAANRSGRHGNPSVLPMLKAVAIENNTSDKSLSDLLEDGAIDAMIGSNVPKALGRNPRIARLFPQFSRGRGRLLPAHRHLSDHASRCAQARGPRALPVCRDQPLQCILQAKDIALARMRFDGMLATMMPWMLAQIETMDGVFGADPWPYGVESNRKTLEALVTYLAEQHLIAKPIPVDDLFVRVGGA